MTTTETQTARIAALEAKNAALLAILRELDTLIDFSQELNQSDSMGFQDTSLINAAFARAYALLQEA